MLSIVVVEWNDACEYEDLDNTSKIAHKPLVVISTGFLLKTDESGVSLCADYSPAENTYRGQVFIPRAMVIREEIPNGKTDLRDH
jgi:hypothetical protein